MQSMNTSDLNPGADGLRIKRKATKIAAAALINKMEAKTIHWVSTQYHLPQKNGQKFLSIAFYYVVMVLRCSIISHIHRIDLSALDDLFDKIRSITITNMPIIRHG